MDEVLKQLEKIEPDRKEKIRQSYFNAVEKVDHEEFEYIKEKIGRKLYLTGNSKFQWIKKLSVHYKNLNRILEEHHRKYQILSSHSAQLIGAALFYFINLYDMIPDYTPDIGYVDDLFVLITCLNSIPGNDYTRVSKDFKDILR